VTRSGGPVVKLADGRPTAARKTTAVGPGREGGRRTGEVVMIEGKDRDETIRLTAEALGIPLAEAAFIYAIEAGESYGDVAIVDADGNLIPPADEDDQADDDD
jgi:hypothetical protein